MSGQVEVISAIDGRSASSRSALGLTVADEDAQTLMSLIVFADRWVVTVKANSVQMTELNYLSSSFVPVVTEEAEEHASAHFFATMTKLLNLIARVQVHVVSALHAQSSALQGQVRYSCYYYLSDEANHVSEAESNRGPLHCTNYSGTPLALLASLPVHVADKMNTLRVAARPVRTEVIAVPQDSQYP